MARTWHRISGAVWDAYGYTWQLSWQIYQLLNDIIIIKACKISLYPSPHSIVLAHIGFLGWGCSSWYISWYCFCLVLKKVAHVEFGWFVLGILPFYHMMTSWNGSIFGVTGPLCGEFTGPGEFPTQRPVTQSFDVFFDLRLNKRLSKQPWGWWFETPSWSLWRQCNDICAHLLKQTNKTYYNLTT